MSKKLGEIEKPSVEKFLGGRKLYCIPLLFADKDALKEYLELFDLFWNQVNEHIKNLEKVGKVKKIYHESVYLSGEEGIQVVREINEKSYGFVKSKCDQGVEFLALEDQELFNEYTDWSICMLVSGRSQKVAKKIQEFYKDVGEKREEYVAKRIGESLKKDEVGVLIMNDQSRMRIQPKLPSDIQVFLVSPPALNDIQQFLRENLRSKQ